MGGIIFLVVVTIIIGLIIWGNIIAERGRKRYAAEHAARRQALWNQYQWALTNMHTDPQARLNVVNAGRAYYAFDRGGSVTLYDEMAISNDIKQAGG